MLTVHPRVCGEQRVIPLYSASGCGSSPRVRGTASPIPSMSNAHRFIPACAGNRHPAQVQDRAAAVHPRVCGEQGEFRSLTDVEDGSSPRVRGTDCQMRSERWLRRFIPACAGNSRPFRPQCNNNAVHPRVCGEQNELIAAVRAFAGSSPRVRGTGRCCFRSCAILRFIPACAGNRGAILPRLLFGAVHPRVCGEQQRAAQIIQRTTGSSPRVRGTGPNTVSPQLPQRFIPACAGNSRQRSTPHLHQSVHPRVCGEQKDPICRSFRQDGSSPRVRGTDRAGADLAKLGRFIPACAGNSSFRYDLGDSGTGSSPRVRGTVRRHRTAQQCRRFIPACAGNSSNQYSAS